LVPYSELVLPILLAAALVFVASALIHTAIKWHNADYKKLPDEEAVRAAIRKGSPGPGEYLVPHCLEGAEARTPEMQKKFEEGPVGTIWLKAPGPIQLGPFLGKWFVYVLVVSAVVAYLAHAVMPANPPYLFVFRVTGTTAWLAYSWQGPGDSIWKGRPWSASLKYLLDGLIYACLTAGSFAWLWPGRV
jgi:hypothetical protein